jgi:glycosyltransferase involved in cell wall biosynthesis
MSRSSIKCKVFIVLNTAWNIYNFRSGLIRALVENGYEVVAVAPHDEYAQRLVEFGCRFLPLSMDNRGTHPGRDLLLLWRFYWLLRQERPNVLLGYTVKPNVYGSLAAHALGIPVVNNIAGLGAVFIKDTWLTCLVRALYRLALLRSHKVFFQNVDDQQLFVKHKLVKSELADLLPGSGINLKHFEYIPLVRSESKTKFLLIARMLWDKGVGEYVQAARRLKQRYSNVEFCLLGFVDVENPTSISRAQLDEWVASGFVNYLGKTDDVRPFIVESDCVVLPSSYREGTPRSLLEAAAIGRLIVTTDAIGCREVVDHEINGFLCKPRDSIDLEKQMEKVILLSYEARSEMGQLGREKVEREFDEQIVIQKYLDLIKELG